MASFSRGSPSPKPPDLRGGDLSQPANVSIEKPATGMANMANKPNLTAAADHLQHMATSQSRPNMSYANMVAGAALPLQSGSRPGLKPRFPPIILPNRQVGMKEGRPAISFTAAEVGACEKRYEFSLVAKFTVGRPTLGEIQNSFQQAWNLSGRATISEIWDARHVLIILDSESDVRVALSSPLHKIGHAFFRLFRWNAEYNPKRESKFATIWVRLHGLPLELYDVAFIEAIISTFGYFVAVDERTKACVAVKYARACVELDVTKPIPDSVWISLPNDKGYWQSIDIESNIRYCSKCRKHGHSIGSCRKIGPNITSKETHQAEKGGSKVQENRMGVDAIPKSHVVPTEQTNPNNVAGVKGPEEKQWQPVMNKKARRRAARGIFETKEPSVEVTNVEPIIEAEILEIPTSSQENVEHLAVVPYISPSQKEKESSQSAEVYFDERLQSHVHPKGYDHYANIRDKAGTASDQTGDRSVSYITQRSKKKNTSGSKHCLSTSDQ